MTFPTNIDLHTAYEDDAPAAPDKVSASTLDSDHLELERWINSELLPALAQIMREDGTLTDYLVRYRNLHPEVYEALAEAAGSVDLAIPADGSVSTTKLALLAVTTGILSDLCVSTAKLADLAVTTAKLADLSVTTGKVADLGVTTGKIADLAVTAAKIADATVTNAKLAQMDASSIKGNDTGAPAAAKDLTVSEARTLLGTAGLEHFAASRSVAAPNATVPAHAVTPVGAEADIDLVLAPKAAGAISMHTPDNAVEGGNKRGDRAVDLQTQRTAADQVASGSRSVILGGDNNKAAGARSAIIGGSGNHVATQDSAAIAAYLADVNNLYVLAIGTRPKSRASHSIVMGNSVGQTEDMVLAGSTTDATPTALPGYVTTLLMDDFEAVTVIAQIVGFQRGGTPNAGGYNVAFVAKRSGSVSLVGSPTVAAWENNAAWDVAISTAANGINVSVTGAAGVTIDWNIRLQVTRIKLQA